MDIIAELKALVEKYSRPRENMTRAEFLERENISAATLNKLNQQGLGPNFQRLPGVALKRLTREDYEAWQAMMAELRAAEGESPKQKTKERRALEQRHDAGRLGGRPGKVRP